MITYEQWGAVQKLWWQLLSCSGALFMAEKRRKGGKVMNKGTVLYDPNAQSDSEVVGMAMGKPKELKGDSQSRFIDSILEFASNKKKEKMARDNADDAVICNFRIFVYTGGVPKKYRVSNFCSHEIVIGNNVESDICVCGSYRAGEVLLDLVKMKFKVLRVEVMSKEGELLEKGREYPICYDSCLWMGGAQIVFKAPTMERNKTV